MTPDHAALTHALNQHLALIVPARPPTGPAWLKLLSFGGGADWRRRRGTIIVRLRF